MKILQLGAIALSSTLLLACGGGGGSSSSDDDIAPNNPGEKPAYRPAEQRNSPTLAQDKADRASSLGPYIPVHENNVQFFSEFPGLYLVDVNTQTAYQVTDSTAQEGVFLYGNRHGPLVTAANLLPTHYIYRTNGEIFIQALGQNTGASEPVALVSDGRRWQFSLFPTPAQPTEDASNITRSLIHLIDYDNEQRAFVRADGTDFYEYDAGFRFGGVVTKADGSFDRIYVADDENLYSQRVDGSDRRHLIRLSSQNQPRGFAQGKYYLTDFSTDSNGEHFFNLYRLYDQQIELLQSRKFDLDDCQDGIGRLLRANQDNIWWLSCNNQVYKSGHNMGDPAEFVGSAAELGTIIDMAITNNHLVLVSIEADEKQHTVHSMLQTTGQMVQLGTRDRHPNDNHLFSFGETAYFLNSASQPQPSKVEAVNGAQSHPEFDGIPFTTGKLILLNGQIEPETLAFGFERTPPDSPVGGVSISASVSKPTFDKVGAAGEAYSLGQDIHGNLRIVVNIPTRKPHLLDVNDLSNPQPISLNADQ